MSANRNDSINARAQRSAEKTTQLSPSIQYAICQVLPNIRNGAFWGFVDKRDIMQHAEAIKGDKNLTARKLGSDKCLIEVNPQYLTKAIQWIDPEALVEKDIKVISEAMVSAKLQFENFLIRKGIEGFGGTVGIYCINDVTTISYKGVQYPAFRVSMGDALSILDKYGYTIQVGGKFLPPSQAAAMGQALWDSATLSPTKTGVFINIKATLPKDQYKQLKESRKKSVGK